MTGEGPPIQVTEEAMVEVTERHQEKRALHWKEVACPTCGSEPGTSCGGTKFGATWWERTAPHVARKRLAAPGVSSREAGGPEEGR
jgi:hypothetical protein